ncbi:hypothetical protein IX296_003050 [Bacteroides pyogenes]|nr:hypothetical protein [Bacteroides pyogenes]MBR8755804.1 hypothetical protein [Bacteroides pyogenes]MBR8810728.1 hypothetical protein [Bacteroides pyogenes]
MKKLALYKYRKQLLVIACLLIGSRVFNHVNAWLGVLITISAMAYVFYSLLKKTNNEKEN